MVDTKTILVAGATGVQGRSIIAALKPEENGSPGFRVLALTRQPNSPGAKALASANSHVQLVQGDLDNPETIKKIFDEAGGVGAIYGVFCVLTFPGLGKEADGEEKQGIVSLISLLCSYVFNS